MKHRVVLRADGSGEIGYGHFIRTLALASYLKDCFDCNFATFNSINLNPTEYQIKEITKTCNYISIRANSIDEFNEQFLLALSPNDIVVLDNYYYTADYQRTIKNIACKLVCIDDVHDRHMVCDLLMTASPLKREDFNIDQDTLFIGGIEWAFLREPFLKPNILRHKKSKIENIVIAMGGADPLNITDKMVKIAHDTLPGATINVIAGDTVIVSNESKGIAKIHRRLNAEDIVTLFDTSDFGVFPASTICIEAFSRQLPFAAGYFVNNQQELYEYGITHKLFYPLGCLLDDASLVLERFKKVFEFNKIFPVSYNFSNKKYKIIQLFKELESK